MKKLSIIELKKKAKAMGVTLPKTAKKPEIIRSIQQAEGNFPCFGTSDGSCDQYGCAWRGDCLPDEIRL